jgi:hypothetical protein
MATISVPHTVEEALDAAWLSQAMAGVTGGAPITDVEPVEVLETVAAKVRFKVAFEGAANGREAFCLKGFLGAAHQPGSGATAVREADFYGELAPRLTIRVPGCAAAAVDREEQRAVVILRDLIDQGARFCSALEPFTADDAAQSVEQLARLHVGRSLIDEKPWLRPRTIEIVRSEYVPLPKLQGHLEDPRAEGLAPRMKDAALLVEGVKTLAARAADWPQTVIHGDTHAGNLYWSADGPGFLDWQLVQRGAWSFDVAYHLCAVMPAEVAEKEERALLAHYLDSVRRFGGEPPSAEDAWAQYRASVLYGYYLWAITQKVQPPIIKVFIGRLGAAATRHDSYRLLGL